MNGLASKFLAILPLLASCSHIYVDNLGQRQRTSDREFFSEYGETVFRRQNQASDAVASLEMAAAPEQDAQLEAIYAAESSMLDACALLNQAAVAKRDNRQLNFSVRLALARSLPDCDLQARALHDLIAEFEGQAELPD